MSDEEVDYIGFIRNVWLKKNVVIRWLVAGVVLGVFIALVSPKEYSVTTKMIPSVEKPTGLGASFGGLASIAGLDIGGNVQGNEIPPSLYPEVMSSLPFMLDLMELELNSTKFEEAVGFQQYSEEVIARQTLANIKKYTIGLPGLILSSLRGSGADSEITNQSNDEEELISVDRKEMGAIRSLSDRLELSVDRRSGVITLKVEMPEPLIAAEMAQGIQKLLQDAVIEFKILKAQQELEFTQSLVEEKKRIFEEAQQKLSEYRDSNLNIATSQGRNQEQLLETEYQLAFSVFNELSQQLENAKINVKKNTPVFSVIQPVVIPIERSKPRRAVVVIAVTAIAGFVGLLYVLLKIYWANTVVELIEKSRNKSELS